MSSFVLQWFFTTTERNNIVNHTKHFRYLASFPAQELFARTGFLWTRVFRFCKSARLQRASRIGRWALSSSVHWSIRKSSTNRVRQDLDPRPLRRGLGRGQGSGQPASLGLSRRHKLPTICFLVQCGPPRSDQMSASVTRCPDQKNWQRMCLACQPPAASSCSSVLHPAGGNLHWKSWRQDDATFLNYMSQPNNKQHNQDRCWVLATTRLHGWYLAF